MPLVRRDPIPAAKAVGAASEDPRDLAAALGREKNLRSREAILARFLAIANDAAAAALAGHLRSEDAGLRNACIETLQAMPGPALSVLPDLLADPDADVRLLATEIARTQPTGTANDLLARFLEGETHPNVCGAAVEVLAEVGSPEAVPALTAAKARFADEAFLSMAIDTVLARIGSGR
ncbi:HEAT repeat domain-containing protein [Methylobacterium sp. NMS14P]|uniref:HEAT repeat domain-containing protein n=1 Tax=Methylobacterium sp. NMS14P TaxID=2894310 RepID=UPI00235840F4|nr:HEAT repeat domain-containing protein [Methylobacterium sp. NMS14P]WCS23773.1 HEAT repeat domain-containing protein [Methylobacterium sp. NMS14P]